MVVIFVFIAGMLFEGVVSPLLAVFIERVETRKEVFMSNHSVIVAQNNALIQKMQINDEQEDISVKGFEYSAENEDDEEYYEEKNHANINRKAGFRY